MLPPSLSFQVLVQFLAVFGKNHSLKLSGALAGVTQTFPWLPELLSIENELPAALVHLSGAPQVLPGVPRTSPSSTVAQDPFQPGCLFLVT